MEDFDWIKRVILRYFRSIENCAPSSYIHGGVHSLNSWWDPPWIWEKGTPFLCTPRVSKNFSNKKWIINNWEMLRNALRALIKNLVKKKFLSQFQIQNNSQTTSFISNHIYEPQKVEVLSGSMVMWATRIYLHLAREQRALKQVEFRLQQSSKRELFVVDYCLCLRWHNQHIAENWPLVAQAN